MQKGLPSALSSMSAKALSVHLRNALREVAASVAFYTKAPSQTPSLGYSALDASGLEDEHHASTIKDQP